METCQLFIDGKWRPASSGETIPATNPFNQEVHAAISVASAGDVAEAVAAARRAYDTRWSKTTPGERAALLGKLADLIVVGNVRMQGFGRVLGSVGNDVLSHAPCSVLIVKTV